MGEHTIRSQQFGSATEAKTAAGQIKAKTESQTLAAANPARVSLTVACEGASSVWLAKGPTAVAEKGVRLSKEGEGNQPVIITDYTGVVAVVSKEGEPIVSFCEV